MKRLFISIMILFCASTALAQLVMEVLPLKHSRPEEMVSGIKGILEGQGSVVVIQNKLVVRTTPHKLAEIKRLLEQIDIRLQNLRITVRQGLRRDFEKQDRSLSADVAVGNSGHISAGSNRGTREGGNVTAKSGDSSVSGHFRHKNLAERRCGYAAGSDPGRPSGNHSRDAIEAYKGNQEKTQCRWKIPRGSNGVSRCVHWFLRRPEVGGKRR